MYKFRVPPAARSTVWQSAVCDAKLSPNVHICTSEMQSLRRSSNESFRPAVPTFLDISRARAGNPPLILPDPAGIIIIREIARRDKRSVVLLDRRTSADVRRLIQREFIDLVRLVNRSVADFSLLSLI